MILDKLKSKTVTEFLELYPFVQDFIDDNLNNVEIQYEQIFYDFIMNIDIEIQEEFALIPRRIVKNLVSYIEQMQAFLGIDADNSVDSITIIAGVNKSNETEKFNELKINKGEIVAIVGPTGSGKSRLLADIEWGANKDTPTKRTVLINDKTLDITTRFSSENKLVAQLSQNMNFVMDLSVYEFIELHAKSRMVENEKEIINKIFDKAIELAGEPFTLDTAITSLSGGQSRALMIADTAILSPSPIILIDEIENAGIDRKKALELLVSEDKIVLMSTHDPILALLGDKRIVISNGGIDKIISITNEERSILTDLEKLDNVIQGMRSKLRYGEKLEFNFNELLSN